MRIHDVRARRSADDFRRKAYSAEYRSQALFDLASRIGERVGDIDQIATIVLHTSRHTHFVIGTGFNDSDIYNFALEGVMP